MTYVVVELPGAWEGRDQDTWDIVLFGLFSISLRGCCERRGDPPDYKREYIACAGGETSFKSLGLEEDRRSI